MTNNGFNGLVEKRFGGDEQTARDWVAHLGKASYFWSMRPGHAIDLVKPFREHIPEFFEIRKGVVVGLNWKSIDKRNRGGRGLPT